MLLEPRMQVNEALVNAIIAKKPIILTDWVKVCLRILLSPFICCFVNCFFFLTSVVCLASRREKYLQRNSWIQPVSIT